MSPETLAQLEARVLSLTNLPSPPGIATHIIELAQDPGIEMGQVAKAVSMDPALTAKILRIANSPLYAQRRKSENLRQALVVLGLNATLTLALSFSLVKSLRNGKPNCLDYPRYWRRALLAATASRALADALRRPQAEEFFLAGLLQDVGMLALDSAMPDIYRGSEQMQRSHRSLVDFERQKLQADHAALGAATMRAWRLPEHLCRAIGDSHEVHLRSATEPADLLSHCVALSGTIADLFLMEPEERQFAETALSVERGIGLDKVAFGQVLGTIGSIIPETESIFDAELLSKQNADRMLDQAREVLMIRSLQALRDINSLKAAAESSSSRALELEEEARRDALTGVYNRAHLDQILAREFDSSLRHRWPLSLAFADLDNFKSVNDRFGHPAGDRILQTTARILKNNTRETDLIARYGGEEFVVVLPATDADTAHHICGRIVEAFQSTSHEIGASHAVVTISIGCATHGSQTAFANVADLVNAADQALYTAKMRGRNRTVPFDRELPRARARYS